MRTECTIPGGSTFVIKFTPHISGYYPIGFLGIILPTWLVQTYWYVGSDNTLNIHIVNISPRDVTINANNIASFRMLCIKEDLLNYPLTTEGTLSDITFTEVQPSRLDTSFKS